MPARAKNTVPWFITQNGPVREARFKESNGVSDGSVHDLFVITGRSDATLNRGGVRLGSAEIYAVLEDIPEIEDSLVIHLEEGDQLLLFVVLSEDVQLGDQIRNRITDNLRRSLSPRHAPSRIEEVAAIPRTLSGKRVEVPVKLILQGAEAESVLSRETLRDPSALDDFITIARSINS